MDAEDAESCGGMMVEESVVPWDEDAARMCNAFADGVNIEV